MITELHDDLCGKQTNKQKQIPRSPFETLVEKSCRGQLEIYIFTTILLQMVYLLRGERYSQQLESYLNLRVTGLTRAAPAGRVAEPQFWAKGASSVLFNLPGRCELSLYLNLSSHGEIDQLGEPTSYTRQKQSQINSSILVVLLSFDICELNSDLTLDSWCSFHFSSVFSI